METADIQKIQARLREINAQMEKLRAEGEELETAVRVFKRFTGKDDAGEGSKLGPARPENLPSLFDMTESGDFGDAVVAGKPGLTGAEIVTAIGKRYWPGVKGQQILPSIYQFSKNGRLTKTNNGVFKLPKE